jgi:hypothetical protein
VISASTVIWRRRRRSSNPPNSHRCDTGPGNHGWPPELSACDPDEVGEGVKHRNAWKASCHCVRNGHALSCRSAAKMLNFPLSPKPAEIIGSMGSFDSPARRDRFSNCSSRLRKKPCRKRKSLCLSRIATSRGYQPDSSCEATSG